MSFKWSRGIFNSLRCPAQTIEVIAQPILAILPDLIKVREENLVLIETR